MKKYQLNINFLFNLIIYFVFVNGINDRKVPQYQWDDSVQQIDSNQGFDINLSCSIYTQSIQSMITEYTKIKALLPIQCQLNLKKIAENLKNTIDEYVDQTLDEYLFNIEEMKRKVLDLKRNSLNHLQINLTRTINERNKLNESSTKCHEELIFIKKTLTEKSEKHNLMNEISLIRNGDFKIAHKLIAERDNNDYYQTLITALYDGKSQYLIKTIEFLNSLNKIDDVILGYRILYEQMMKNGHQYSTDTSSIAYRVFSDFRHMPNNENLAYLKAHLPQSLLKFPWNQTIVLRNELLGQYIHFGSPDFTKDISYGNSAPTQSTAYIYYHANLIPINSGTSFYIERKLDDKNYGKYMYADSLLIDNQRRHVNRHKLERQEQYGKWQLEPIENSPYFKIKNVHWNEYFMIDNNIPLKGYSPYLQTFTLTSGKCDFDGCKWNFPLAT